MTGLGVAADPSCHCIQVPNLYQHGLRDWLAALTLQRLSAGDREVSMMTPAQVGTRSKVSVELVVHNMVSAEVAGQREKCVHGVVEGVRDAALHRLAAAEVEETAFVERTGHRNSIVKLGL